jgi:molybdopterin converting factor small subunit
MRIHVLAFARLRELLGAPGATLELPAGARAQDAWAALVERAPALDEQRDCPRIPFDEALEEGDELAVLPPVGGG